VADEKIRRGLEAWKVAVTVQQHFNDIEMKIRNYALTLLLAVFGAAGLAVREEAYISLLGLTVALGAVVLFAGLLVWMAFYFMDELWYHRLLLGAVKQAIELEKELQDDVPGIGLTNKIKDESALKWRWGDEDYELRSTGKIRVFYWFIAGVLLLLAVLVQIGVRVTPEPRQTPDGGPTPTLNWRR
jgi:hypothetical protein